MEYPVLLTKTGAGRTLSDRRKKQSAGADAEMIRRHARPLMIAIGGMSGCGKTTLANGIAARLPRSVVLDSDVIRKEMHGVPPSTPLPLSAYTPEATLKFIRHIHRLAGNQLRKGNNVIVTGTFLDNDTRRDQQALAEKSGADFTGIYLDAPLKVLYDRVARRKDSASDADQEVVRRQVRKSIIGQRGLHWHIIRADLPPGDVLRNAVRIVLRDLQWHRARQRGPSP